MATAAVITSALQFHASLATITGTCQDEDVLDLLIPATTRAMGDYLCLPARSFHGVRTKLRMIVDDSDGILCDVESIMICINDMERLMGAVQ